MGLLLLWLGCVQLPKLIELGAKLAQLGAKGRNFPVGLGGSPVDSRLVDSRRIEGWASGIVDVSVLAWLRGFPCLHRLEFGFRLGDGEFAVGRIRWGFALALALVRVWVRVFR